MRRTPKTRAGGRAQLRFPGRGHLPRRGAELAPVEPRGARLELRVLQLAAPPREREVTLVLRRELAAVFGAIGFGNAEVGRDGGTAREGHVLHGVQGVWKYKFIPFRVGRGVST